MIHTRVVRNGWLRDELQPRTDTLYADFTYRSRLLPAEHPWRFLVGDLVRILSSGECVLILDGFLHVQRAYGRVAPASIAPAGSTVLVILAVGEGASL